jgi:hypothetical protein
MLLSTYIALNLAIAFGLIGCAYSTGRYGTYYQKNPDVPKKKPIAIERVRSRTVTAEKELPALMDSLIDDGFQPIGHSGFIGALEDDSLARALAANVGGDHVVVLRIYRGKAEGFQMVVGSYTPGRTIMGQSTDSGYGSSYGSGSYNGTGGYGYGSSSAVATSTNYTNTSVYVPPQVTYVRQPYIYDNYEQGALIFLSPEGQASTQAKQKR